MSLISKAVWCHGNSTRTRRPGLRPIGSRVTSKVYFSCEVLVASFMKWGKVKLDDLQGSFQSHIHGPSAREYLRGQRGGLLKDTVHWLLPAKSGESSKPWDRRSRGHPSMRSQGFSDKHQGSVAGVGKVGLRSSLSKLSFFTKVLGWHSMESEKRSGRMGLLFKALLIPGSPVHMGVACSTPSRPPAMLANDSFRVPSFEFHLKKTRESSTAQAASPGFYGGRRKPSPPARTY